MDISRLKKKDLEVWIPLFDGIEIQCRHLTQNVFDDLHAQSLSVRFNPRTQAKAEEVDDIKFSRSLARAVVIDWRGITEDDKPWPCTPENIDFLMGECTEFRLLVRGAPLSLEKMLAMDREADTKNSKAISGQK